MQLPEGEDLNEWLAVHGTSSQLASVKTEVLYLHTAVDFFNHLNMLYGTVTEFCTPQEVRIYIPQNWQILAEIMSHSVRLCLLAQGWFHLLRFSKA